MFYSAGINKLIWVRYSLGAHTGQQVTWKMSRMCWYWSKYELKLP